MMRRAQPWLGTLVEIAIADSLDDEEALACFRSAFAAIGEVHRLMSFHDPASDVSRINRASAGEAVQVHSHTYEVLRMALSVTQASGGIFDMTCAPQLVKSGYLPAPDGAIVDGGTRRDGLVLEESFCVRKTYALWIDLGGIAKGYAVDVAMAALQCRGVRSARVNAGGDLRVIGETTYPVLIRNPRSPREIARQVDLKDAALATSANYFAGQTTSARSVLIDGRSGQACPGDFSVTVQAPSCMLADALTKVVAASGDDGHAALAHFGAAAFII